MNKTEKNSKSTLNYMNYCICLKVVIFLKLERSLTLSPQNKLSFAFLFCFNIQSASMSLKIGEMLSECQTAWIMGEKLSYLASHPD